MAANSAHEYIGFKVVAAILTAMPIEQALFGAELSVVQRVLLAVSAGAGAALLVMVDRPKTVMDAASRIGVGVACGFLFVPYLCDRWSIHNWNGSIALSAGVGSAAWFVVGAFSKVAAKTQTKDWLESLIRAKLNIPANGNNNQPASPPGTERTVNVHVTEKTTTPIPTASAVVGTGRS